SIKPGSGGSNGEARGEGLPGVGCAAPADEAGWRVDGLPDEGSLVAPGGGADCGPDDPAEERDYEALERQCQAEAAMAEKVVKVLRTEWLSSWCPRPAPMA